MKYRIIGSIVVIVILVLLWAVFSGSQSSDTPADEQQITQ